MLYYLRNDKSFQTIRIGALVMYFLITKYLCTAAIVVIVSEIAKRSAKLGSLIAAMPLMTLLILFWLYYERQPDIKITNHAWYTFWYVLPTLPMFFTFPALYVRFGFWSTIGISVVMTAACFLLLALIMRKFNLDLLL